MRGGVAIRAALPALAAVLPVLAACNALAAQENGRAPAPLSVNDEWERYVRVLQVAGDVPRHPWSLRAFAPLEALRLHPAADRAHPWSGRGTDTVIQVGFARLAVHPLALRVIHNSAFPFGYNDGPVWTGRGLTTAVQAGVSGAAGPLTWMLAPMVFRAENTAFAMMEFGFPNPWFFSEAFLDGGIDTPQRFGPDPYQRFEPGNTMVRLDLAGTALGFTTANEHWGPARDHPVLLGNNAPGFPRVFLGTSGPANVGIGRVSARMFWGRLASSPYTYMQSIEPHRFVSGLAAVFVPRGAPGLEIGGSRMSHVLWSDSVITLGNLTRTLDGIVKAPEANAPENQLASAFARWVSAGLEVYAEFGREDYAASLRDLFVQADHAAAFLVGFQRVLSGAPQRRTVVRGELLNTRIGSAQLVREQGRWYTHGAVGQGHTHRGQVLGSIGAYGGGAATLGVDRYSPGGRQSVTLSRIMRAEKRAALNNVPEPLLADVMHALTLDGLLFRGRMALLYEATAVRELNRHFAGDAFNLRLGTGIQYAW